MGMFIRFRKNNSNGKILNLLTLSLSILSKVAVFLFWQVHNGTKITEFAVFLWSPHFSFQVSIRGWELKWDCLPRVNRDPLTLNAKSGGMNM